MDALDEIHADLALADTWVAESVIPYVSRGQHSPAKVDVLAELEALRSRLAEIAESALAPGDTKLAGEYGAYCDLLSDVYRAFIEQRTGQ